jgi:DNA invertase Pin-like site-specific DNA recombinase
MPVRAAIYRRVSTTGQDAENQRSECERIAVARGWAWDDFQDVASGAKRRPHWDAVVERCRRGEYQAVVVWALDRVGRSRVQVAHDLAGLFRYGVEVVSVKDSWLDQARGPLRDLLVQILGWVAEGERARLIERTNAGLTRARAAGKVLGRPRARIDLEKLRERLARNPGESLASLARMFGVSRATVRPLKRKIDVSKKGITDASQKAAQSGG